MEARDLSRPGPRVDEVELSRLARVADRLRFAPALQPFGPSVSRRRAGRGLEFLELRAFGQGDDPRSIDWRATARWGRPLVRSYQDEAFATAWLCLDRSASMGAAGSATWQRAVQVATGLAFLVLHGGHRLGLLVFSGELDLVVRPARGRAHFARVSREIARMRPRARGGASRLEVCAGWVGRDEAAFVVSDFLREDALRGGLGRLRSRGAWVHALAIGSAEPAFAEPTSAEPTAEGGDTGSDHTTLWDVETGARREVRLDDAARAVHRARRLALLDSLAEHCRQTGTPLTVARPDSTWRDVLVDHLRSLEPRRV